MKSNENIFVIITYFIDNNGLIIHKQYYNITEEDIKKLKLEFSIVMLKFRNHKIKKKNYFEEYIFYKYNHNLLIYEILKEQLTSYIGSANSYTTTIPLDFYKNEFYRYSKEEKTKYLEDNKENILYINENMRAWEKRRKG